MTKTNMRIISEYGDDVIFLNRMFSHTPLSDYQEANDIKAIRSSLYKDISEKYNIPRRKLFGILYGASTEVLRSLAVFGDHYELIEAWLVRNRGRF